jgi:hypothetical protein
MRGLVRTVWQRLQARFQRPSLPCSSVGGMRKAASSGMKRCASMRQTNGKKESLRVLPASYQ